MHCPGRTAGGRPRTWGTAEGAGAIWVSQGGWAVAAAGVSGAAVEQGARRALDTSPPSRPGRPPDGL